MVFKLGDKAFYPAHGVGVVEGIESKEIAGSRLIFYILRILETDITIMVPTNNVEKVGLRKLISHKSIGEIYKILEDKKTCVDSQTWNRRYREYMGKIKTGSASELAWVLRDLCILKRRKDLSFGERKMLDTARGLLVKEISVASGRDEKLVAAEIEGIFTG